MNKRQTGFTLVEIAIVMVIIGLLLGGVLKGQEVITNAKIKNVGNDFNGVSAAIYSYQDRYAALPGDDLAADAHVGGTNGNGNGEIEGTSFDSATAGEETRLAWTHLRAAGLVSGEATDQNQPSNAFNGVTGVLTGNGAGTSTALNGISSLFIGFSKVDGDMAVILDTQNDDGNGNTGSVRSTTNIPAGTGATATPAGQYSLTTTYALMFAL